MNDAILGRALLILARGAIDTRFGREAPDVPAHPDLDAPGATFVTLQCDDHLRGCIGTLIATRPLRVDVVHNALNAAFADPRFPPLDRRELVALEVEVSRLTPPTRMECADEASLLEQLRPGVDGLVLQYGERRGTFLPQVWDSLPEPHEFVRELKRKAGLPADFWHRSIEVSRYTVDKWTEREHLRSDQRFAGAPNLSGHVHP